MRKIIILFIGVILTACYGIKDENFDTLAPVKIDYPSDIIYAKLGAKLNLDVKISSSNNKELRYEWSYGREGKQFPDMATRTVISDQLNLDYAFSKVGKYILRLMVDNSESIEFKYFTLQVQTGLDEGIIILNEDDNEKGMLTFIKTRNPEEIENNEQEIWENIMETINPDFPLKNVTDVYFSSFPAKEAYSLLVSTKDELGSIYKMNPRTFELYKYLKMEERFPGVKALKIVGEYTGSSAGYCLLQGSDKDIYRYDLFSDDLALRASNTEITDSYEGLYNQGKVFFFYNNSTIIVPSNNKLNKYAFSDCEIVNMAFLRKTSKLLVVTKSTKNTKVAIHSMGSTLGQYKEEVEYEPNGELCIDRNSIIVTSKQISHALYNYKNKIYKWDISTYTSSIKSFPETINIPAGEQIMALGINGDSYNANSVEDRLFIATYNPNRVGEKKGSLYIYNITDLTEVKRYEGVCHKPIKVIYKPII